jgi:translation initiation factor 2 alpha subunit (eIF-2alpha)
MGRKAKEVREIVKEELVHIPEGPDPQMELRMAYWNKRMYRLSRKSQRKKTVKEVLEESVRSLEQYYPNFEFKYDVEFFNSR